MTEHEGRTRAAADLSIVCSSHDGFACGSFRFCAIQKKTLKFRVELKRVYKWSLIKSFYHRCLC